MPITTEPSPHEPPAGVAKVRYVGAVGDAGWGNRFWLLTTGTPTYAQVADLATDLYGVYQTNLLPVQSAASNLLECIVTYYDGAGNMEASAAAVHSGAASGAAVPVNAAGCISWKIGSSYRGGKPRTYLPGVVIGNLASERTFNTTYLDAVQTGAAAFIDDVNGLAPTGFDSVSLGVVHFFSGGVALSPPTFDPYLAASVQTRVCSQRRRLGRELF